MNKLEGLKSALLKQDIVLAKKLQNVSKWKKKLNFDDKLLKPTAKSKFDQHPREIDSESESIDSDDAQNPVSARSSTSSINAGRFKEDILRQALSCNMVMKDYTDILNENLGEDSNQIKSATSDLIFGGESLDFLQNYRKSIKEKLTKKFVEDTIQTKASENRTSIVRLEERSKLINPLSKKNHQVRKKLKMQSRKCSVILKSDMMDSLFEKKFKSITEKTLHGINDVYMLLEEGIAEPDGEEDFSRRIVRVKEFSSRFVRNYLYPLNQQLKGFENTVKSQNTNQKLITCYQLIFQGIQSYHNHLPTSVGNCAAEKLNSLMENVLRTCETHMSVIKDPDENVSTDYIFALKVNAEKLMNKITESFYSKSTDSILKSNHTKLSLISKGANNMNKKKMQSRYAMYTSSSFYRKDVIFRKTMEQITKKKYNVKSRYKTATFKHRPPLEKPASDNLQSKCKLFTKKSSSMIRSTPLISARIDDTVQTQIEVEQSQLLPTPKETESREKMIHDGMEGKLLQLVHDTDDQQQEEGVAAPEDENKKVKDMLHEYFRNKEGKQILQELANELQKEHDVGKKKESPVKEKSRHNIELEMQENKKLELKLQTSQTSTPEGSARSRKEPTITVTGAKNAKLICITDDNSVIEEVDDKKEEPVDTCLKCSPNIKQKIKDHKATRPSVKINRMPKTFRSLSFFSDNHAINIIQYKLEFRNACKKNPLYMKTTNLHPWILMGKLSDEILDYAVLQVAKEIELNNITDQVYQEEMQL